MTAPMTPADCDLRGYEWMPLFGARLFNSMFEANASDLAFRIAIKLYWEAWQQVPAASLPNDDVLLCRLAGLGRDLKTWRKLRADGVLHGFLLCADDRLYHQLLADEAVKAWKCRQKAEQSRVVDNERLRRWRAKQNGSNPPESPTSHPPNETRFIRRFETPNQANETPDETLARATDQRDRCTKVQEERKKVLKLPYFGEETRARGEELEQTPLADEPETFARKPDEPLPEKFQAHVRRTSRAMAMSIPYAEVRSVEAQLEALRPQPAAVGADETMGLRWQPAEPVRTIEQMRAEILATCTPEQIAKAQRYAARSAP